ncbi:hypothetical protein B0H14DRAFT_2578009 [Mycena olivaceomarginata]|nr:hypothetical protein B0H14DRAFT_2578009 [Mycena olivaceomarginata]
MCRHASPLPVKYRKKPVAALQIQPKNYRKNLNTQKLVRSSSVLWQISEESEQIERQSGPLSEKEMTGIKHAVPKEVANLVYKCFKAGAVATPQGKEYDNVNTHVNTLDCGCNLFVEVE